MVEPRRPALSARTCPMRRTQHGPSQHGGDCNDPSGPCRARTYLLYLPSIRLAVQIDRMQQRPLVLSRTWPMKPTGSNMFSCSMLACGEGVRQGCLSWLDAPDQVMKGANDGTSMLCAEGSSRTWIRTRSTCFPNSGPRLECQRHQQQLPYRRLRC